jgi:3-hydroxyisobutyrate dehydrogenase/glyoxylate/succinic semialdehyde reductase
MKIGFIGLGIMGSRMATNLLRNNYEVVVYNRTQAQAESLVASGAEWANSPANVAKKVHVLFTMLSTPDVIRNLAIGKDGFLECLQSGSLWVDCSTVGPSFALEIAEEAQKRHVRFVEAPVAGSKDQAADAELLFIAGGSAEDVDECRPILMVMGSHVLYTGGHATANGLKLVFNLLLAQAMLAFSEALILGQSLDFSRDWLLDVLLGSAVVAPFLSGNRTRFESESLEVAFPLQWMHKDLNLAMSTAYMKGLALPSTNTAKEVYALAANYGLREQDFSTIYQFLKGSIGAEKES